eukprot:20376_1
MINQHSFTMAIMYRTARGNLQYSAPQITRVNSFTGCHFSFQFTTLNTNSCNTIGSMPSCDSTCYTFAPWKIDEYIQYVATLSRHMIIVYVSHSFCERDERGMGIFAIQSKILL